MSNTNMVLGSWRRDEWPEYITVSHDGMREPGRRYVPERTCHKEWVPGTVGGTSVPVCSNCGRGWEAAERYCANCGARVVDE